jgi:hypothetical protein
MKRPLCRIPDSGISSPELLFFLPFLLAFPALADNFFIFGEPIFSLFVRLFILTSILLPLFRKAGLSGFWLSLPALLSCVWYPWEGGTAVYAVMVAVPLFQQLFTGDYRLKIIFLAAGLLFYGLTTFFRFDLIAQMVFFYLFLLTLLYGGRFRLLPLLPGCLLFYFSLQTGVYDGKSEIESPLFSDLRTVFAPQAVLLKPPSPGFMRNIGNLKADSLLFPLHEPPAFVREDGFRLSRHWLLLHEVLQDNYPAFYVFNDDHGAYFLGFRTWDDFLRRLKTKQLMPSGQNSSLQYVQIGGLQNNIPDDTSLGLPAVLLSQSFGYQEMMVVSSRILSAPKRYSLFFSPGGQALPLERYHHFFPLLLARKIFASESHTKKLVYEGNSERSIKYFLSAGLFEHSQNFLFFLRQRQMISPLFNEYWQAETELAAGSFVSAARRAEILLLENPDEMRYKVLLFRALQKREKSFVSYGPNFDYELMAKMAKEFYENKGDISWLKQHFNYGRKMMAPPPEQAFGGSCGESSCGGGSCGGGSCGDSGAISGVGGGCSDGSCGG